MKSRHTLLGAALLTLLAAPAAQAQSAQVAPRFASIALRPEPALLPAVQQALLSLSSPDFPISLDASPQAAGPVLALGGPVAFNPDEIARTRTVGSVKRIELNPNGPLSLSEAVKREIGKQLGLKSFTPQAVRLKLSGVDVNSDGTVDLTDLALLMGSFGKTGQGDLNHDGRTDESDLQIFSQEYQIP